MIATLHRCFGLLACWFIVVAHAQQPAAPGSQGTSTENWFILQPNAMPLGEILPASFGDNLVTKKDPDSINKVITGLSAEGRLHLKDFKLKAKFTVSLEVQNIGKGFTFALVTADGEKSIVSHADGHLKFGETDILLNGVGKFKGPWRNHQRNTLTLTSEGTGTLKLQINGEHAASIRAATEYTSVECEGISPTTKVFEVRVKGE